MVVFVDVDDTLVRWAGPKPIPRPNVIGRVRQLKAEGALLYLWSTGGADYARDLARQLQIEELFEAFLPKPNLILDDQLIEQWPDFQQEYPW